MNNNTIELNNNEIEALQAHYKDSSSTLAIANLLLQDVDTLTSDIDLVYGLKEIISNLAANLDPELIAKLKY